MVGAMLLMVAMAGVVPFFLATLNQSASVRFKSTATNIARERMEQIRQLDYREIVSASDLASKFGGSETIRDVTYGIVYAVQEAAYESGVLKQVTVTVDWTAPPKVSPASVSTMIHQQFVGPRVERVELTQSKNDPLGTPFPCLNPNAWHTIRVYIAEADWGLVLENPNGTPKVWRDFYIRLNLVDEDGITLALGAAALDYKLDQLDLNTRFTCEEDAYGKATKVWVEYDFDSSIIPDGYWEFQATAFNRFDEPGNVWCLRTRVENKAPEEPTAVAAVAQFGDESVRLYWSGGAERDRVRYEVQRCNLSAAGPWMPVDMAVDPKATSLLDEGDASVPEDPWGDAATSNWYRYQIRAVDICNPANTSDWVTADVILPGGSTATTTTLVPPTTLSTTTTLAALFYWVNVENKDNKDWDLVIECANNPLMSTVTTIVARKSILKIENLRVGNYLITASAEGREDRVSSFALDADKEQTVMTIY